jgi:hypothetical protein
MRMLELSIKIIVWILGIVLKAIEIWLICDIHYYYKKIRENEDD